MRKLKKKSDGKVYDCNVTLYWGDLMAVYWNETRWTMELLSNFVPAVPGIDY